MSDYLPVKPLPIEGTLDDGSGNAYYGKWYNAEVLDVYLEYILRIQHEGINETQKMIKALLEDEDGENPR